MHIMYTTCCNESNKAESILLVVFFFFFFAENVQGRTLWYIPNKTYSQILFAHSSYATPKNNL